MGGRASTPISKTLHEPTRNQGGEPSPAAVFRLLHTHTGGKESISRSHQTLLVLHPSSAGRVAERPPVYRSRHPERTAFDRVVHERLDRGAST
jgi:hypothetical protein